MICYSTVMLILKFILEKSLQRTNYEVEQRTREDRAGKVAQPDGVDVPEAEGRH